MLVIRTKFELWTLGEIEAAAKNGDGYASNFLEDLYENQSDAEGARTAGDTNKCRPSLRLICA